MDEEAVPAGRLRRAARWLFAQAPERPGLDPDDAPWTADELAQLAETFSGRDEYGAAPTERPSAAAELARRLATLRDNPAYDPRASSADPKAGVAGATPAGTDRPPGVERPAARADPPSAEVGVPADGAIPTAPGAGVPAGRPRPYRGAPGRPAVATARPSSNRHDRRPRRGVRWAVRTGVLAAIVAVAVVLLRGYVVSPYYIPSASMEPTLHGCPGCNDDRVLVDKLSYRMHDIHRGDIVVFHRPTNWTVPEKTLIKRVIGLPGDRLAVRGGKLYVNGLLLEEPYLNSTCPPLTGLAEPPAKPRASFGPVPLDAVFVMGDNRCDSTDSRAFGPVPEKDIVGRAFLIAWPLGRIHSL